jgi:predicted nucleic acid-binding protein
VGAKQLRLTRGASLWDALILAACVEAGVATFYSEDLPGFDDLGGVRVVTRQLCRTQISVQAQSAGQPSLTR